MELEGTLKLRELGPEKAVGQLDHFSVLFYQHQALVRAVIWQIAGDCQINDLVQEVFIKIWKGLPQFRGEANLTSWIYRISVNVALDSKRSYQNRGQFEVYDFDFTIIAAENLDHESELHNRQIVQAALQQLSADHRTVVVLALIHDLKISEIAQILTLSEGTVKSRLHYGKESFKKYLRQRENNESL